MVKFGLALLMFFLLSTAQAETYLGLNPNDSFSSIKSKFPNARFIEIKAAWLKPDERFKEMTGEGIVGIVYLKLSTNDTAQAQLIDQVRAEVASNPDGVSVNMRKLADSNALKLSIPFEDRLTLDWMRWAAPNPIPMSRIESKYGKADKCGFTEDTFAPYCEWQGKGITAYVNDKKDFVSTLEFVFTSAEWRKALGYPPLPTKSAPKK